MRRFSVLVVLALLLSATPAAAQTTGSISGTVTDGGATQLAGIQVCAFDNTTGNGACDFTGADGSYTVAGLEEGLDYQVDFFDPNGAYLSEFYDGVTDFGQATYVVVTAGQDTAGIDASLEPGGSISGLVTDAAMTGLDGIQVCASNLSFGDCTNTAADGTFTLVRLGAGTDYRVDFYDNSGTYAPELYDNVRDFAQVTPVTVTAGQSTTGIVAALDLAGSISGTVTDDAANPLAGLQACAQNDMTGFGGGCSTTLTDGTYVISGLVAGESYHVSFSDPNGVYSTEFYDETTVFDDATLVPVAAGQTTSGIDASLGIAGSISGMVTDSAAVALGGINVCANSNSLLTGVCTTSATDGTYTIDGLSVASDYFVEFYDNSGVYINEFYDGVTDFAIATLVVVASGQDTPGIDASLDQGGSIAGTVVDSGANSIEGISVCAYSDAAGTAYCGNTLLDGTYEINGVVPASDYQVSFDDPNGAYLAEYFDSTDFNQATPVVVTAGQTTTGINASLDLAGSISGEVTDSNGAPISDVFVCAFPDAGIGGCETTGIDGSFIIGGLPAGVDYRVDYSDFTSTYAFEYFDDTQDFNQATLVAVVAGQTTPGINAVLEELSVECGGKAVTVNLNLGQLPTTGPDVILGTPGPDVINGLAGDDTICGKGGADIINGGGGIDEIFGGEGDDVIGGQGGDDVLFGDGGSDRLNGGVGDDRMFGGLGDDDLRGQGDNDSMYGNEGIDQFFGGSGNDYIDAGLGGNRGTGQVVRGGGNNDIIYGSPGDDDLEGISGLDELYGLDGDDRLRGGNALDRLWGGAGNDLLEGGAQRDFLYGGDDNDELKGGTGNDDLFGEAGSDILNGQGDTDLCDGGADSDTATASCETLVDVP